MAGATTAARLDGLDAIAGATTTGAATSARPGGLDPLPELQRPPDRAVWTSLLVLPLPLDLVVWMPLPVLPPPPDLVWTPLLVLPDLVVWT